MSHTPSLQLEVTTNHIGESGLGWVSPTYYTYYGPMQNFHQLFLWAQASSEIDPCLDGGIVLIVILKSLYLIPTYTLLRSESVQKKKITY